MSGAEPGAPAQAVSDLLDAARKSTRTVRWAPQDEVGPERFEVTVVASGEVEQVVSVDAFDGEVYDDLETMARLRGLRAGAEAS